MPRIGSGPDSRECRSRLTIAPARDRTDSPSWRCRLAAVVCGSWRCQGDSESGAGCSQGGFDFHGGGTRSPCPPAQCARRTRSYLPPSSSLRRARPEPMSRLVHGKVSGAHRAPGTCRMGVPAREPSPQNSSPGFAHARFGRIAPLQESPREGLESAPKRPFALQ
jgi:hypothetical protein